MRLAQEARDLVEQRLAYLKEHYWHTEEARVNLYEIRHLIDHYKGLLSDDHAARRREEGV